MSRPHFGSIYRRGNVYWIKYFVDGKPFYESSKSDRKGDAERLLEQRRVEIATGIHLDTEARRVRIGQLLDELLLDYEVNGKDHAWAERVVRKHLRPDFARVLAAKLNRPAMMQYVRRRQESGAANATINKALALLHRAFVLGAEAGKVGILPRFPKKLPENNVRKGFFEWDQFVSARTYLPPEIKPVITFAYWTGCRKGEILTLRWPQVDLANRVVRLEPGETKNDEPRTIPLCDELYEMLRMQKAIRDEKWPDCPWLFVRQGNRIKNFRKAWETACLAAGLIDESGKPERLFHDLRRTGIRNLVRAGVPEKVAMTISGHKTRSVFDRYNIVSDQDLREAARKQQIFMDSQDESRMVTKQLQSAKVPPLTPRNL